MNIAGQPNAHRFRSQRAPGSRALRRAISTLAEPRATSVGARRSRSSERPFLGAPTAIITSGQATTGKRLAICGFCLCDSTLDICG